MVAVLVLADAALMLVLAEDAVVLVVLADAVFVLVVLADAVLVAVSAEVALVLVAVVAGSPGGAVTPAGSASVAGLPVLGRVLFDAALVLELLAVDGASCALVSLVSLVVVNAPAFEPSVMAVADIAAVAVGVAMPVVCVGASVLARVALAPGAVGGVVASVDKGVVAVSYRLATLSLPMCIPYT